MQTHDHGHHADPEGQFSSDATGLPVAVRSEVLEPADGDAVELRIAPVAKRLGDATVRMLAYNGSVPGPTLRVREGSELVVDVANEGDLEATVHWHGLRLDNRYDGTHETQAPIPVGGRFTYRLEFPDPGVYWYHPHIREDYGQELGLYGNIVVVPVDEDYWPPVHREVVLTLDDVLLEDGRIAPFSRTETNYAAMGRFGNELLIGGETQAALAARVGEVVRLYLTNTANTRVFNVALPGARMKLVGGDSGRVEREEWVESVVLAPSERAVVDVSLEHPGPATLEHRTPERTYALATIEVAAEPVTPSLADRFGVLRHNPEWKAERERLAPFVDAPPDKTLAFVAEMDLGEPEGPVVYACPMHPDVVRDEPGRCPQCGMKLLATAAEYVCPMHPEVVSHTADRCPRCGMKLVPATLVAAGAGHGHGHGGAHGHGDAHGHGRSDHGHDAPQAAETAGSAHEHGGHQHGGHQHEAREHDAQEHGGHEHGGHEHGAQEHGAQEHGGHEHGGHEHGGDAHGGEEHQRGAHEQAEHHEPGGEPGHAHAGAHGGGIEWEDDMVDVNRLTTPANMRWNLVDRDTGAVNHAIDWRFRVGDRVKLRLVNELDSDHPMHHPFHVHGAGRFVVLARDGAPEPNLVWKDTVLVRTGETVDLLLDVTHAGVWMAHCHIAEHHESGMMFSFEVMPAPGD